MVGIVILNYNSSEDTINCVHSIKENSKIPYMIYVVDGSSSDDSFSYLSQCFKDSGKINVIKADKNGGYSYGNNLGAVKAINDGADAVLIINPDVVLTKNAIELMYDSLFGEDDLAVVGPRILDPEGRDTQFAGKLYTFTGFLCSKKPLAFLKNRFISSKRYHTLDYGSDFKFTGMVSGCCFMIKSDIFRSIGLFDANLFLYYEEDIIAYKLSRINYLTKYISAAVVVHSHSVIPKKQGMAFIRYHRFLSAQYVLRKYAGINFLQYLVVTIIHVVPFTFGSIISGSYRKLYPDFLKRTVFLWNHSF
jgi:GT2 family glycosyltransferase